MIRIVLFLLFIALAAAGAAWIADQPGSVVVTWGGVKATAALPVFALGLGIVAVAAILVWSIFTMLWRAPGRIRRHRHERRHARGRHAITQGLLAIGHGDSAAARQHADQARRLLGHDPLTLLLHAQSAQLEGDRDGAKAAFHAMAERNDTRLLGLRGLFIEAQRADDAAAAVMATQAVLGFRCAKGDWNGAVKIHDNNLASGLIDKPTYRRQRGVLLAARALELETVDRDLARESAMEAVKLAPTLIPAAVLAAKFESEAHQVRRAMRIVETAWLAQPHPDLADAYAHVRLGDAARQRLVRVETLAAKTPGHIEGALAVARAAIDASEFARARQALQPFIADPTQRVAVLMAELERTEHGDSGKARAWTLRAVRARHDPAWTADGYVSDRWRPVSPVTGRLDAFQWQTPVASLPSDQGRTIESSAFEEAMLAASPPKRVGAPGEGAAGEAPTEPMREMPAAPAAEPVPLATKDAAIQDNAPLASKPAKTPEEKPEETAEAKPEKLVDVAPAPPSNPPRPAVSPPAESIAAAPAPMAQPLFRARPDLAKPSPVPPVIPIVRPPDDPGVDDDAPPDEFSEQIGTPKAQAGGWRGFWARLGG
jgi:HemY protein